MTSASVRARPVRTGRLANISGAVLVGGASQRMGRDKSRLMVDGVALAARAAGMLAELFEDVVLVGGEDDPGTVGRWVADGEGPRSALRGLVRALEASDAERVMVLATDMPLVQPDLLLAMIAFPRAEVVVPETADGLHPLCALYDREATLPVARARLEAGKLRLMGLIDSLGAHVFDADEIEAVDPGGRSLVNVNTPEDLASVEKVLLPDE